MSGDSTGRAAEVRRIPLTSGTAVVFALVPGRHPVGPRA